MPPLTTHLPCPLPAPTALCLHQSKMSSADPVHAALAVSSSRQLVAIAVGMQLRVLDTNEKVARVLPLAAAAGVAVPPLVRAAAFSPDSSRLAATTDDKQLHMWDTQSWECELTT